MKNVKTLIFAMVAAIAMVFASCTVEILPTAEDAGVVKADAQAQLNATSLDKPVILAFVDTSSASRTVAEVNSKYDVISFEDSWSVKHLAESVYVASKSDAIAIYTNDMTNAKTGFAGTLAAKFGLPLMVTDNLKDYTYYTCSLDADNGLTFTETESSLTVKATTRTLDGNADYDAKASAETILATYSSDNLLYLSGPMTGLSDETIEELFTKAEEAVAAKYSGSAEIVNPSAHNDANAKCWADYLARDVYIIEKVGTLFQIQNMEAGGKTLTWKTSGGSNIEYYTYKLLGGENIVTTDTL